MATFWTIIATVVVAAMAIAASVHAIMTRRETGTAVAWVGVIWLSPVVGAVLYYLLGINRIKRRARELRPDQDDAFRELLPPPVALSELATALGAEGEHLLPIVTLGDRVTGRPLLPANRLEPLDGGDEAYPAMIDAIEQATRSVTLMTYIFDNDDAGKRFATALADAHRRGVAVRVLVDDVGARYSFPPIIRQLKKAGVRTARFMPALFPWRMAYLNLRNHRKVMVVDGRLGFTGGMNIREQFWSRLMGATLGRDLHFKVQGPVVAELQEVFAHDWRFATGERLIGDEWFPPLLGAGATIARGISDGPDVDFEKLHSVILGAIAAARRSVTILTPYFVPDQRLLSALTIAAGRGVEVTIILPEKSNLILVQWASTAYWAEVLQAGCSIMVTPPPFDHAKLMLVDGAWALLGSANIDPRSLQLNFEFNVECFDPELVRSLQRLVHERLTAAREVTLDEARGRPFQVRFRNRLARLLSPYL